MPKILKSKKTLISLALFLVSAFLLGYHLSESSEGREYTEKSIAQQQQAFAAALRDYYTGQGELEETLILYHQLQADLKSGF